MQSQVRVDEQVPLFRNVYPLRGAPDSLVPCQCVTQSAAPYNTAQSSTQQQQQQGSPSLSTGPGIGRFDDVLPIHHPYGRDVTPGFQPEFNYSMAGLWEAPVPQPPSHSGYTVPSVHYDNPGQGRRNSAQPGYYFAGNQPRGQTIPSSPLLTGAHAAPNDQGAFTVWVLANSWVSYSAQDEFHVTMAFRRTPSA